MGRILDKSLTQTSIFSDEQLYSYDQVQIQKFQEIQLRKMLKLISTQHPIYRKVLSDQNISIKDIQTFADLDQIFPVTTKEDFVSKPLAYVLEPERDNPKDYLNWDVTYTAGTSGMPAPVFQTTFDFKGVLFAHQRMAKLRGMTKADTIFNLYPLAPYPHGGWIRPSQAAAVIGAAAVVGMSGSTTSQFPILRRFEEVLDLVSFSNPSVLWGVPSYVLKVLRGLEMNQSKIENLRLINVSGEPCGQKLREHLLEAAKALTANQVVVSDSLGATEMQFSLVECDGGNGFHNPVPEIARLSVIDHTGKELPDGESGRLQVTHINRRGTVLIKYLLGDLAIMDQSSCPNCGWAGGRIIKHLGREGKFVKVRGQMVNSQSIQDYLDSIDYITDYKVSVSQDPLSTLDELSVDLATKTGSLAEDDRMTLQAQLNDLAGLRTQIQLVELSQIWEPEAGMKPKRFVDLRVSN